MDADPRAGAAAAERGKTARSRLSSAASRRARGVTFGAFPKRRSETMRQPEPFELVPESDPEALLAAALERAELEEATCEETATALESDPAPARRGRGPWR
jgi:hypothetical protein